MARIRRRVALTALAVVAGATTLAAGPSPSTAAVIEQRATQVAPITWLDGEGRQLTATSYTPGAWTTTTLVVARDLPDGSPDASWGSFDGAPGLRELAIAPPAPGLQPARHLGVDPDGVLVVPFGPASCSRACATWLVRTTADGTVLGATEIDQMVARPALPDGSFLRGVGGAAEWIGPDGAVRAALATQPTAATTDAAGRLITVDGTSVRRFDADGDPDLEIDRPCTGVPRLGPAAGEGFVVGCWTTDDLTLVTFDDAGAIGWTRVLTPAESGLRRVHHLALDTDGDVWAVGEGPDAVPSVFVDAILGRRIGSTGAIEQVYRRAVGSSTWLVEGNPDWQDLRPLPGGGVLLADLKDCCGDTVGAGPWSRTFAARLPGPPLCRVGALSMVAAAPPQVRFDGCAIAYTGIEVGAETSYEITVETPSGPTTIEVPPTTGAVTATLPAGTGGQHVTITATAVNEIGPSTVEPRTLTTVAPFPTTEAFVDHVVGHIPVEDAWLDAGRITSATGRITTGSLTPAGFVGERLDSTRRLLPYEEVTRLYRAYFLRDPDRGGLRYWTLRRADGTSLGRISEFFADSSEFRNRYGTLTHREFVAELYENVFDRPADPGGLDFWTRRLERRTETRGRVVLQFSESSEGRRLAAPVVDPVAVTMFLLDRVPTAAERTAWAAAPDPRAAAITDVLASPEFAATI